MRSHNPIEVLASMRHESGEHGGVNISIETSTSFTVMAAETMPRIFDGARASRGRRPPIARPVEGARSRPASGSPAGTAITSYDEIDAAFTDRTRVLYAGTMANPMLVVPDIPKLAEIAPRHGAMLVIDNTFCPVIMSPAPLGADVVVHSLTKLISGSSDIIAGAICGTEEFVASLVDLKMGALMFLGPTMDPTVAFHISLHLPHLGIRMAEHSRRAHAFAERLDQRGTKAVDPGLPVHPPDCLPVQRTVGQRQSCRRHFFRTRAHVGRSHRQPRATVGPAWRRVANT